MATTLYRRTTMKTVTATEAKNNLGSIIAQAQIEPIMVESRGKPTAVVLSMEAFEEYEKAREWQARRDALSELMAIRDRAEERNKDLSKEDSEALITEIVDETFARMIAEGKIEYQP
ncbi:hypothetical protein BH09CHL1_BH09CHL1_22210 [soil metagenome]